MKYYNIDLIGPVYKSWNPRKKTRKVFWSIKDFLNKHKIVTVRQIFYGMVSTQVVNNTESQYQRVDRIVRRGRLAGLIPFNKVIDDSRDIENIAAWDSPKEILEAAINQYRSDWWRDNPYYVEVWLEKRALKRILEPITKNYGLALCPGVGYPSWSYVWESKKRFQKKLDEGKEIVILYFGDLDPSGKDILRDLQEKFNLLYIPVDVREIALNIEQKKEFNLPTNPSKEKEPRKDWFVDKYGIDYSVELDALPPDELKNIVESSIENYIDPDELEEMRQRDREQKEYWKAGISNLSQNSPGGKEKTAA